MHVAKAISSIFYTTYTASAPCAKTKKRLASMPARNTNGTGEGQASGAGRPRMRRMYGNVILTLVVLSWTSVRVSRTCELASSWSRSGNTSKPSAQRNRYAS